MASNRNPQLSISEPLRFHTIHGDEIRLSENNTRAARNRLSNNLIFTNRPVLPNEIIQLYVEDVSDAYQGLIRTGFTTIDPATFTPQTLPKSIPPNDNREWFVPVPLRANNVQKNKSIRLKYTAEGDIHLDYEGNGFVKQLTVPPITKDIWCALDMNGGVAQIRLVQAETRVLANATERATERHLHYTNNRQQEYSSIYYSGELTPSLMSMKNCDERCEVSYNIAVKKTLSAASSVIVEENLKRCMYIVMQILDMDHTLSNYLTIRCLTDGRSSNEHTKLIDPSYEHLTIGDEIGIRVQPDGQITFSCDNRHVKPLFTIDLTVNDNPQVEPTKYFVEFLMNGRVTGLRMVGVYQPTAIEARTLPPAIRGGCQATIIKSVCPNGLSGLLLPCRHLCVCFECGQALVERHTCPNVKCRKPVTGCIKVYKD